MNWKRVSVLVVMVAVLVTFAHQAISQSVEGFEKIDQQAAMKRFAAASTPGEPHKFLEQLVGDWDTEMSLWPMGPGSQPMKSKGTASYSWLMEGRWLQSNQSTPMPMMGGNWDAFYIFGFDNYRRKFVSMAVNSMETVMNTASGNASRDRKSLVLYGQINDPMTREIGKQVKLAIRFVGPDEHVLEIHDLAMDEVKSKVLEMRYTRKKNEK